MMSYIHVMLEKLQFEMISAGVWGNPGTILISKAFMSVVTVSFFLGCYVYLFYVSTFSYIGYVCSSAYYHCPSYSFKLQFQFSVFHIIFSSVSFIYARKIKTSFFSSSLVPLGSLHCAFSKF